MKILVVGSGGREHAIIKKLRENKEITEIYALPGNGGIATDAVCVPVGARDIAGIKSFAVSKGIDFAVVAPDDPLVLGAVDELEAAGIPCFGPDKKAAIIEGSKAFSKAMMKKYDIPTADYEFFSDIDSALAYVDTCSVPVVVKADGLALGKGVVIAKTRAEAKDAITSMMRDKVFGESGSKVILEEFLTGPEVSVLTFTDGKTVKPMISSMDHKCAGDNDTGPNTGGMGAVAPNPYYTDSIAEWCMENIFIPTVNAMNSEGRSFKGCLYFGLMLTPKGPRVIEYNCRFGDPEAQAVLPLMKSDLYTVMRAVRDGKLDETEVSFSSDCSCCVVMASEGYPVKYKTGYEIYIPEGIESHIFIAGAVLTDEVLYSSGGRVLGITSTANSLHKAISKTYCAVSSVHFKNAYFRKDIGRKALGAYKHE